jgi:hypothetical protein
MNGPARLQPSARFATIAATAMPPSNPIPRLALLAVGGLLGLVAGELLARALGPSFQVVFRESIAPSADPSVGYELRPGSRDGKTRISSAGLRDREYEPTAAPNTWRLAAIGDSITYGSGVPQEAGFSAQLEALLDARRTDTAPRIEVLNFGVPGYNVEQVVARLATLAPRFAPNAIVYGYALNDPQAFSIEAEALRRLQRDLGPGDGTRWFDRVLAHSRLFLLARRVALERRSREALRADMPNDPAYEAAKRGDRSAYFRSIHREGESAARLARGLDALAAFSRERSAPVLVAIFPLFQRDDHGGPEALADVHAFVAAEVEKRGLRALDLLPVYLAATRALGSDLAVDFMHPDPIGQRVAAYALLEWMCRNAWPGPAHLDCARVPAQAADASIRDAVLRGMDGDSG